MAQESLEVSFETSPAGGKYAPENVVAVWVETAAGDFIKTLGRWSDKRTKHLVAWTDASGQDVDGLSGATRAGHNERLSVTWDMLDRDGVPVPDGAYVVRMELADLNAKSPEENNQGRFAFEKTGTSTTQMGADGGFENVALSYSGATSATCGDGTLDEGETCDPIGSCPSECPTSGTVCLTVELVGSADSCTAECVESPVTACTDNDGCCPSGCNLDADSDCDGTSPSAPDDNGSAALGGCSAGSSDDGMAGLLLWCLALAALRTRRWYWRPAETTRATRARE